MKALDMIFVGRESENSTVTQAPVWFPGVTCHAASERDYITGGELPLISEQVFGPPNTAASPKCSQELSRPSIPLLSCRLQMSPSRMRALLVNTQAEVPHLYPSELSLQNPNWIHF